MNQTALAAAIPRDGSAVGSSIIPFASKKVRPIRHSRDRMTFLTPEETLAVLKAARARSVRDWAMILLAYRHGLRASELVGLKLADVDLKAGSISVRRLKGAVSASWPAVAKRGIRPSGLAAQAPRRRFGLPIYQPERRTARQGTVFSSVPEGCASRRSPAQQAPKADAVRTVEESGPIAPEYPAKPCCTKYAEPMKCNWIAFLDSSS
jgi:integrase